jgi:hypothetical protein
LILWRKATSLYVRFETPERNYVLEAELWKSGAQHYIAGKNTLLSKFRLWRGGHGTHIERRILTCYLTGGFSNKSLLLPDLATWSVWCL